MIVSNNFWETEEIIGEIEVSDRGNKILVKNCTKNGKHYTDIRKWDYDGKKEIMLPTSKGIAISEEFLNRVIDLLITAKEA